MPTCSGHVRINGIALGACLICAHQAPGAVRQLCVPAPGPGGVWNGPMWQPLPPATAVREPAPLPTT